MDPTNALLRATSARALTPGTRGEELSEVLTEAQEHWAAIQKELADRHLNRARAGTKRNTRTFHPTLVKRRRAAQVDQRKAS